MGHVPNDELASDEVLRSDAIANTVTDQKRGANELLLGETRHITTEHGQPHSEPNALA